MRDEEATLSLTPEDGVRMDRLLGRWADRSALSPARADSIRAAILETPSELDAAWWGGFFARMTATLSSVPQSSGPGVAAMQNSFRSTGLPVGPHATDAQAYQAYYRL